MKKNFLSGRNFRIMAVCFAFVIAFDVVFHVPVTEWIRLLFCLGIVLSLEMVNISIEKVIDPFDPKSSKVAGAVLINFLHQTFGIF